MHNYNIKGTGIEVTDELRSYVGRRLAHADKFLRGDPSARVSVELEHASLRDGDRNRAELTVAAGGAGYPAEHWGETMHSAIDVGAGGAGRGPGRHKQK